MCCKCHRIAILLVGPFGFAVAAAVDVIAAISAAVAAAVIFDAFDEEVDVAVAAQ